MHIIMVIIIDMSGCLTSTLRPPKAESSRPYDIQVHREIVPAVGVYTQYLYKYLCVYVSMYRFVFSNAVADKTFFFSCLGAEDEF